MINHPQSVRSQELSRNLRKIKRKRDIIQEVIPEVQVIMKKRRSIGMIQVRNMNAKDRVTIIDEEVKIMMEEGKMIKAEMKAEVEAEVGIDRKRPRRHSSHIQKSRRPSYP